MTELDIPSGDYNFSAVITTSPADAFLSPGPGGPGYVGATHPALGDIAGTLASNTNLGLNNGSCNTNLAVPFTFLYATVDNSGANEIPAIPQANTGPLGTLENMATDTGDAPGASAPWNTMTQTGVANGIPASVERYPAYLNDLFNDVQPLQRLQGNTVVAGTQVNLNLVTFSPGDLKAAFPAPSPFNDFDASIGYTTISVLQDTTVPAAPSSITDFCTVLNVDTFALGTSETNNCNGVTIAPCNTSNGITAPASGGNDTGKQRYRNPPGSTHVWYAFLQSLRDLDGDGFENAFDSCPIPNDPVAGAHLPTYDYRTSSGPDGDGLDGQAGGPGNNLGCDPTPTVNTGAGNHDGDTAAGRAWNNGQDNCPRVTNGTQADTDGLITTPDVTKIPRGGPAADSIGDACDPDPNVANGQFTTVLSETAICIGGTDADGDGWCATHGANANLNDPNDGNVAVTPEHYARVVKMPIAHSGSGVNALVGEGAAGSAPGGLGVAPHGDAGNTGSFSGAGMGQPYQACNDGVDNDLDTLIDLLDPGCTPTGLAATDSDGDGYSDQAELHIGTDALGRCEEGAVPTISTDWPSDLRSALIPNSTDRINIHDLASFVAPDRHLGTSPGDAKFDQRWDLAPGKAPLATWINILDLAAMTAPASSSGGPPMFSGARAFLGPLCTSIGAPFGD